MGGVTAVFEMPNTKPETTTPEALADKIRRGTDRMHCDFAFWVGGTHDNIGELARPGAPAGRGRDQGLHGLVHRRSLLVEDDAGVAAVLRQTRRRAAFHSEDEEMLRAQKDLRIAG